MGSIGVKPILTQRVDTKARERPAVRGALSVRNMGSRLALIRGCTPSADIVSAGSSGVGHPIVRFIKEIGGESYTTAFELRAGRKTLAPQSFWIGRP